MIYPEISVRRTRGNANHSLKFYTNFGCRKVNYGKVNFPTLAFCKRCYLSPRCDINNKEFVKFYEEHCVCPQCKDTILDVFYLYLLWRLNGLIKTSSIKCCFCEEGNLK